jgi:hypothetical protein
LQGGGFRKRGGWGLDIGKFGKLVWGDKVRGFVRMCGVVVVWFGGEEVVEDTELSVKRTRGTRSVNGGVPPGWGRGGWESSAAVYG